MADYESPSEKWGFMNQEGELVIEAVYDDVSPFSEGFAAVNIKGKWGFIDKTGDQVVPPIYKSAWSFHEGLARVQPFDLAPHYIDASGTPLRSEEWSAADDFQEGLAIARVGQSFGFINDEGNLVIQPIFSRCRNFHQGVAIIEYNQKAGAINKNGDYILPPEYDKIHLASDSILLAEKDADGLVYDLSGKLILKMPSVKWKSNDRKTLCVKQAGDMFLISLEDPNWRSDTFPSMLYLNEHRWAVKVMDKYRLMNSEGMLLSENEYAQINRFSEGIAAYSKGDYWGYLDTTGNELTEPVFGLAWDYRNGLARAAFEEGIGFINHQQKLAFYPPENALDLRDFSEGLAAILIE